MSDVKYNVITYAGNLPGKITEDFRYGVPQRILRALGDVKNSIEQAEFLLEKKDISTNQKEAISLLCDRFFKDKNTYAKDSKDYMDSLKEMAEKLGADFVIEAMRNLAYEQNLPAIDRIRSDVADLRAIQTSNIFKLNQALLHIDKQKPVVNESRADKLKLLIKMNEKRNPEKAEEYKRELENL